MADKAERVVLCSALSDVIIRLRVRIGQSAVNKKALLDDKTAFCPIRNGGRKDDELH